jgi:hypothetical protein
VFSHNSGKPGYQNTQESNSHFLHRQENYFRSHIHLPSPACDPTTGKDLKRTLARVSLSELHKAMVIVKKKKQKL